MDLLNKQILPDLSDQELLEAYRQSVTRGSGVEYSPNDFREELLRRSQDRNARIMNRWTAVIAIATIISLGATIYPILRGVGWLP